VVHLRKFGANFPAPKTNAASTSLWFLKEEFSVCGVIDWHGAVSATTQKLYNFPNIRTSKTHHTALWIRSGKRLFNNTLEGKYKIDNILFVVTIFPCDS
jgi:hypothetical protein